MKTNRRTVLTVLVLSLIAYVAVGALALAGTSLAPTSLYECNWCHQQYQGNSPPAFVKCPAKDNKQNHFWIKKS
ncbi:MAG: hypothetical protein NTY87_10830 [Planctomycetia bacterium]|nr:hypothetical protein [Planctomycetia bacterium]